MFAHHTKEKGSYRAFLHYGKRSAARMELAWGGRTRLGISFEYDEEDGWGGSLGIGIAAIYLHVGLPRFLSLRRSREVSLSFHNAALWWHLWVDPMGSYPHKQKWRNGSFHFDDVFLGKSKCERVTLEERDILVPMPEKSYPAHAKLVEYTWTRPRWFAKTIKRVEIEVPEGIPHAGKGENSWDCGDDATFSITTGECRSITEGVGKLVGSCLSTRVKNGGWGDYQWERPKVTA